MVGRRDAFGRGALAMAVAADALGAERVKAVMMPSQYTAGMSREDAALLDLLVEAAQGAFERLVLTNSDFCQPGITSHGRGFICHVGNSGATEATRPGAVLRGARGV